MILNLKRERLGTKFSEIVAIQINNEYTVSAWTWAKTSIACTAETVFSTSAVSFRQDDNFVFAISRIKWRNIASNAAIELRIVLIEIWLIQILNFHWQLCIYGSIRSSSTSGLSLIRSWIFSFFHILDPIFNIRLGFFQLIRSTSELMNICRVHYRKHVE